MVVPEQYALLFVFFLTGFPGRCPKAPIVEVSMAASTRYAGANWCCAKTSGSSPEETAPFELEVVVGKSFLCFALSAFHTASAVSPIPFLATSSRQHVVVFIDALQSFTSEPAFHGKRHQEILSHEPLASRLQGSFVPQEFHPHRPPLPDPPG